MAEGELHRSHLKIAESNENFLPILRAWSDSRDPSDRNEVTAA
jgi:hypothetical protein